MTAQTDMNYASEEATRSDRSRSRTSMIVFFSLGFGIPWASAIAARMAHAAFPERTPAFMVGAAFCSIGGAVAIYVERGRPGLKELAARCTLYRVSIVWWLYAVFLPLGVHAIATLIYGAVHGGIGPFRPMELFREWWLFYVFAFGMLQGPLAEELGWRGFLLPLLLKRYSPVGASVILGFLWAAWHIDVILFSSFSTIVIFAASAVALSILMTVMFLHTRGSVLLAIAMHGSVVPGKDIARISFPNAPQPPDWLRAVVVIVIAIAMVLMTGRKLSTSKSNTEKPRR